MNYSQMLHDVVVHPESPITIVLSPLYDENGKFLFDQEVIHLDDLWNPISMSDLTEPRIRAMIAGYLLEDIARMGYDFDLIFQTEEPMTAPYYMNFAPLPVQTSGSSFFEIVCRAWLTVMEWGNDE